MKKSYTVARFVFTCRISAALTFETKGFECKGCSNNCEVIMILRDNKIIDAWGNRCERGNLKVTS